MNMSEQQKSQSIKEQQLRRFRYNDLSHPAIQRLFKICLKREETGGGIRKQPKASTHGATETKTAAGRPAPQKHVDPRDLLGKQIALPSLPRIFSLLIDLMSDEKSSADDFARVIMKDPSLAARLLRVVNSAYYGFRGEIDTISQAVVIVGTNDLYALCLGTSVLSAFKSIPIDWVDLPAYWQHSIACGIIAREIGIACELANKERLFVGGLLHDIGRLLIYQHLAEQAKSALAHAEENTLLLSESETQILGFNHAGFGGMLIKRWRLPLELDLMIRHHHQPHILPDQKEAAVIHIADIIANALQTGTSGERLVPRLDPNAWDNIGIKPETLDTITDQLDAQLTDMIEILMP